MRYAPVAICLLALCLATVAEANSQFTSVLHARVPAGIGACTQAGLPTCLAGSRPVTQLAAGADFRLYLFVNNYTQIQAMQTGFAWPADWSVDPDGEPPVVFGCRTNQLNASEPANPGGPQAGTLATAFDCFQGPALCLVARIDFLAGAGGCLNQINPAQGTARVEILDCSNVSTVIDANDPIGGMRLGSICVGTPGRDACDPVTPVQATTWGSIKASYR
jgi:hypothetical protein